MIELGLNPGLLAPRAKESGKISVRTFWAQKRSQIGSSFFLQVSEKFEIVIDVDDNQSEKKKSLDRFDQMV